MSEVSLEAIAGLIKKESKLQLESINTKLEAIGETVSGHTGALFEIKTYPKIPSWY